MTVKNFLIRGRPGSGKSTAVSIIEAELRKVGRDLCGIKTPEIREGGKRKGFYVVDLSTGRKVVMAVVGRGEPRVGRYAVRLGDFESVALPALGGCPPRGVALIDEIGKMELLSPRFREAVLHLLDSPLPVVATGPSRDLPFLKEVASRSDVEILWVKRGAAEAVARSVLSKLHILLTSSSRL